MELISGASRARTGDLRAASATLSQLSYGPAVDQFSGEFVVLRPVDPLGLIVPRRAQPQLDVCPPEKRGDRQQVTLAGGRAVRGESVDLLRGIAAGQKAIAAAAMAAT